MKTCFVACAGRFTKYFATRREMMRWLGCLDLQSMDLELERLGLQCLRVEEAENDADFQTWELRKRHRRDLDNGVHDGLLKTWASYYCDKYDKLEFCETLQDCFVFAAYAIDDFDPNKKSRLGRKTNEISTVIVQYITQGMCRIIDKDRVRSKGGKKMSRVPFPKTTGRKTEDEITRHEMALSYESTAFNQLCVNELLEKLPENVFQTTREMIDNGIADEFFSKHFRHEVAEFGIEKHRTETLCNTIDRLARHYIPGID